MPQSLTSEAETAIAPLSSNDPAKSSSDPLPANDFPSDWKLTASEVVILRMLFSFEVAKKDDLVKTLYGDSSKESSLNTLKVFIHHLRKKTQRLGMDIKTIYGVGYALTDRDSWVIRLDSNQLSQ